MTDPNRAAEFQAARDALYKALTAAQAERHLRATWVEYPGDNAPPPEPGWVVHERGVMLATVNRIRERRGLPPVDEVVIRAAERQAEGHVDYTADFVFYAAQIAAAPKPERQPAEDLARLAIDSWLDQHGHDPGNLIDEAALAAAVLAAVRAEYHLVPRDGATADRGGITRRSGR